MPKKRYFDKDVFHSLVSQEEKFFRSRFLAPVFSGGKIYVKIENVLCKFNVVPPDFEGWGIFGIIQDEEGNRKAKFEESPSLADIRRYLSLFPRYQFVISRRDDESTEGILFGDYKDIHVTGEVTIHFPHKCYLFDVAWCAFDGKNFIFIDVNHRYRRIADALRQHYNKETEPDEVNVLGASRFHYIAYTLAGERDGRFTRMRVKKALENFGATMEGYKETDKHIHVDLNYQGERVRACVDKKDLTLISAGICLSGEDRKFDLQSLPSLLRERANNDNDDYYDDEDYYYG